MKFDPIPDHLTVHHAINYCTKQFIIKILAKTTKGLDSRDPTGACCGLLPTLFPPLSNR